MKSLHCDKPNLIILKEKSHCTLTRAYFKNINHPGIGRFVKKCPIGKKNENFFVNENFQNNFR